jgi:hypothetical protein
MEQESESGGVMPGVPLPELTTDIVFLPTGAGAAILVWQFERLHRNRELGPADRSFAREDPSRGGLIP